jgi:hypothetical protein
MTVRHRGNKFLGDARFPICRFGAGHLLVGMPSGLVAQENVMQIAVTEFRRKLKLLKFADEPVHITKRGKYMGVYVSEIAKAVALAEEKRHRDKLNDRGFTPEIMANIKRYSDKSQV